MARKLTEEERNNINLLTSALVAALPAHLRGHAGSIASSLVRIPREVISVRDINRIVGRCGEHKAELKAAIRDVALEPVEAAEGAPESFVLRPLDADEVRSMEDVAANDQADEAVSSGKKRVGVDAAAGGGAGEKGPAEPEAEAAEAADAEKGADGVEAAEAVEAVEAAKPKRNRRRRRVGDKGGLKAEAAAAAEAGAEVSDASGTEANETRKANEAQVKDGAAEAVAVEEPVAEPARDAAAASASVSGTPAEAEASEDAPAPKKRRRTRRSRKKPAAEVAAEAAQTDAEPEGSDALLAEETAGSDVVAAPVNEDEEKGGAPAGEDSAIKPVAKAAAPAEVSAEDESLAETLLSDAAGELEASQPAPAESSKPPRGGRGRGRRGGNGRSGNDRRGAKDAERGQTLAEVPYVRRGGDADAALRERIVQLDQRFWMNGWLLSHPGAFQLYEKELVSLNEFLVSGTMIGDVTRRQLAYQMGGDEKFFEYGSDGFKLLRAMGVEDLIRHRPMPKADLLYHAPRRRKHMRVLVTENLDPWLDVHDLMYEDGVSQILGERIHAVVLGGGMPVLEPNRLHLLLDVLGADSYEVLYWGDIDRAGLDILIKLRALLDGKFEVKPFVPAYQLMCDRAMERFPDPLDNEKTSQVNLEVGDTSVICDGLTPEAAAYAKAVIEACELIPQEILTKRDL